MVRVLHVYDFRNLNVWIYIKIDEWSSSSVLRKWVQGVQKSFSEYRAWRSFIYLSSSCVALTLLNTFFGYNWGQSYLASWLHRKITQKCLEILLLLYNLHILLHIKEKKERNFRYRKKQLSGFFEQLLSNFLRNYGKPSGKSWATCGKPYSQFWQQICFGRLIPQKNQF